MPFRSTTYNAGFLLSITLDDDSPIASVRYDLSVSNGQAVLESACTYLPASGRYDCDRLGWRTKQGAGAYGPYPPAIELEYETQSFEDPNPIGVYPELLIVTLSRDGVELLNEMIEPDYDYPADFSRREIACRENCRTAFVLRDLREP